jgi:putative peptidoglycan lipid II flippase
MEQNKSLIKSTRTIGAGTLASRILGFVRDVVIAGFFGTGLRAQAFVVSFRIPNLLRSIVAEGGTNSAVVPVLSRIKSQGKDEEFWQAANCLLNILIIALAAITLLGQLFSPYIVRAIAPGFIQDPEKLQLTIRLTRFLFPYILLIGLSAYAMAILNSLKHFTLPALAPCMLNISLIASALIFSPRLQEPVDGLVIGVLVGGLLQIIVQAPLIIRQGLLKKRFSGFIHPRIKEMWRLFLPRILGIAVYQINIFVDTIFASFVFIVGEGAPAALPYANRIVHLPLAIFGIALAQVALPTLSGLAEKEDFAEFRRTVSFSLRSVFTLMLPATLGIFVLARPLVKIIFERGSFTSYSTEITSFALLFYCLGLTGYAGKNILTNSFYALRDTLTPSKIAGLALLINIILNFILMRPLKIAGLALATAVSVTIYFIALLATLQKRIGKFKGLGPTIGRVSLASVIMAGVLWFSFYQNDFLSGSKILLAAKLGISVFISSAVYFGLLKLFAKEEAKIFSQWILRKR